ncbi:MAG: tripartite tricarboxylate transporter substrate-binding protein, partial [Burkholderiales bacterium]
ARAKFGEESAYADLYDYFAPRVYRFFRFRVASREQAEDLMQRVFVKMIETLPGYEHTSWNGMWAPAKTPKDIISRLNVSLGRILKQQDVLERLRADGREPAHSTPEEFSRVIEREIEKWNRVVKAGNIKVQ